MYLKKIELYNDKKHTQLIILYAKILIYMHKKKLNQLL